jgi:hypothetical protein
MTYELIPIVLYDMKKDAISKFDAAENYQDIVDAILAIDELSSIARKEGLLAVEDTYCSSDTGTVIDSIKYGIINMVDGTCPEILVEIMSNEYFASKYKGNQALKQYILIRGVLAVQSGMNPRMIEELLFSLLPLEIQQQSKKELEYSREKRFAEHNEEIIDKYKDWTSLAIFDDELYELVNKVDDRLLKLSDWAIQRLLREIDFTHIVKCLIYSSEDVRQHLLNNMSKRLGLLLLGDMFNAVENTGLDVADDIKSMQKILSTLDKLVSLGEIDIPW